MAVILGIWAGLVIIAGRLMPDSNPLIVAFISLGPGLLYLALLTLFDRE